MKNTLEWILMILLIISILLGLAKYGSLIVCSAGHKEACPQEQKVIVFLDEYERGYKDGYWDGVQHWICINDGNASLSYQTIPWFRKCVTIEEAKKMGVNYSSNAPME